MLTLPIFTLLSYSVASSSSTGAIILQGPHHSAQKSTTTGVAEFRTSWEKFPSVNVTIFATILPLLELQKLFQGKRSHHQQKHAHESGYADDHGHHGED